MCCCGPLQVSFSSLARLCRSGHLLNAVHLKAASSQMSLLPPLSSLLHLTNLLGEEGFKCRNESGKDFKVSKTNLRRKGRKKMILYQVRFINTVALWPPVDMSTHQQIILLPQKNVYKSCYWSCYIVKSRKNEWHSFWTSDYVHAHAVHVILLWCKLSDVLNNFSLCLKRVLKSDIRIWTACLNDAFYRRDR